jgi:hypothetical protein
VTQQQPYPPQQAPYPGQSACQQPVPYPGQTYPQQPEPGQPYPPQQPAAPYPGQPAYQSPVPQAPPARPAAPETGAPVPPKKKSRAGLIVGIVAGIVVLLAAAAAAWFFLLRPVTPTQPMPSAYAPVGTGVSGGTSSSNDNADSTAAGDAVVGFYQAIDTGDFTAAQALVTSDTSTMIDKSAFANWTDTTFEVARSVIDGDSASVFGHESHQEFGSATLGVEFTLVRGNGSWLIQTWQPVDEATIDGTPASSGSGTGATTLNEQTASGIVSALLKARQHGDSATIRTLTTAKFQQDYGDVWLDGIDNSPYFTKFTVQSVKASGAAFVVTVREEWNSGPETATYTVVDQDGTVLVDSWTSK